MSYGKMLLYIVQKSRGKTYKEDAQHSRLGSERKGVKAGDRGAIRHDWGAIKRGHRGRKRKR